MQSKAGNEAISPQETKANQQESSTAKEDNVSFEQKLRTMSTSELMLELGTLKWHYTLLKDNAKLEKITAIEIELTRRKNLSISFLR